MKNIGNRILKVQEASGLNKTAFAERVNLSQPYVSQICTGAKTPSDRTIADIVREFNVNEVWLRTGEGEMFRQLSRDDEIAQFIGSVLSDDRDNFKKRFISALSKLDEREWEAIERMAKLMAEEKKKDCAATAQSLGISSL